MTHKPTNDEPRTIEQIREHYEIEKELANRLRHAPAQERRALYPLVYDELFKRVPLHPTLTRKFAPSESALVVAQQLEFIQPFLRKDVEFLEVGPGDCALSFAVSRLVRQVYAVDVSAELTKSAIRPPNFKLILSDGSSIPLPGETVQMAYSNQLMEHLHPDDAFAQLENICRTLAPGGIYVCLTPNRLSGPHDVSQYFDDEATGFHLKEYTTLELSRLFRKAGFSRVRAYIRVKGKYISLPVFPIGLYETLLDALPHAVRKPASKLLPSRVLLGIRLAGIK